MDSTEYKHNVNEIPDSEPEAEQDSKKKKRGRRVKVSEETVNFIGTLITAAAIFFIWMVLALMETACQRAKLPEWAPTALLQFVAYWIGALWLLVGRMWAWVSSVFIWIDLEDFLMNGFRVIKGLCDIALAVKEFSVGYWITATENQWSAGTLCIGSLIIAVCVFWTLLVYHQDRYERWVEENKWFTHDSDKQNAKLFALAVFGCLSVIVFSKLYESR